MQKSLISFILLVSSLFYAGASPSGYNIEVTINGLEESQLLLAYHFGNRTYIKDTVDVDQNGTGVFSGREKLPGGIYLVVMEDMNYFEIMVDKEQEFSIETDTDAPLANMKVEGSEENSRFLEYQLFMNENQSLASSLRERISENSENPDSVDVLQSQLEEVNNKVQEYWDSIIAEKPGSFLAALVKGMKQPEVPDFEIPPDSENPDSLRWTMRYNYNRDHYFDNIDFSDERLLRTPVMHNRIENYFDRVLKQHPDSIIPQADLLISKTRGNEDVYQYVLTYLLNKYEKPSIMGLDEVFVHLAEEYYLSGETPWASEDMLNRLRERVERMKPSLIGRVAEDLSMKAPDGSRISLHELDADYTIIYFYEPECSFCKDMTPQLVDMQNEYSEKGVEIFAVYIYNDPGEWETYIDEYNMEGLINVYDPDNSTNFRFYYDINSIPTLYMLDADKEIIAKQVGIDTLKNILEDRLTLQNN